MGACISENKPQSPNLSSVQVKIVHRDSLTSSSSGESEASRESNLSSRLNGLKANLKPLSKGIEQRNRIMGMSSKVNKENSFGDSTPMGSKVQKKSQNNIMELKVKKTLANRSDIFRETLKSLSTMEKTTAQSVNRSSAIMCSKCLNEISTTKYANVVIEAQEYTLCKQCASTFVLPPQSHSRSGGTDAEQKNAMVVKVLKQTLSQF